jgi:hypothetical protein
MLLHLRRKRYGVIHFIGTAPSLDLHETLGQISSDDLVILCNRGYRLAPSFEGKNVLYLFFDKNISMDREIDHLPESWVKFCGFGCYSSKLAKKGFHFLNDNGRLYSLQQKYNIFRSINVGVDRQARIGVVSYSDALEHAICAHYTIAFGALQIAGSLKTSKFVLHGCDFEFSANVQNSYAAGIYNEADVQDLQGKSQSDKMVATCKFGIECLIQDGISFQNGSSRSKFVL